MACTMVSVSASCGCSFTGRRVAKPFSTRPATRGVAGAVMMKKGIHPEWFDEAQVICKGVEVMRVGGTKPVYSVDVYSGNHPFYQGTNTILVSDDGQLSKFKKRFAGMDELMEIAQLQAGPAEDEPKKVEEKGGKKGRKGKK